MGMSGMGMGGMGMGGMGMGGMGFGGMGGMGMGMGMAPFYQGQGERCPLSPCFPHILRQSPPWVCSILGSQSVTTTVKQNWRDRAMSKSFCRWL